MDKNDNVDDTSHEANHAAFGTTTSPEPTEPKIAVPDTPTEEKVEHEVTRGRRGSSLSRSSSESQRTHHDDEGHDVQVPPHRSRSRHSRVRSTTRSSRREAIQVPRGERRGLLARFAIMAEVTEPYDYTRSQKWAITFIVAVAAAAAPMGSAIILPSLSDIQTALDTGPVTVNLSVALYMLSMSIFPLWWSSFSETNGRRTIYIVSFALAVVFNILAALSVNIAMFIVTRALAGGASAAVQAVGAGTVADVWEVKERGAALSIFYLGPLMSPLVAPFIGGGLALALGWRSVQWFLAIFALVVWVLVVSCLPETLRHRKSIATAAQAEAEQTIDNDEKILRPVLTRTSTKRSVHVKTKKILVMVRRAFIDPLRIVLYLKFPAIAMCVSYASILFGTLYILNIAIESRFSQAPYNYSSLVVGLCYLSNSLGYFIVAVLGGRWIDRIMHREARKAGRYDERGRLVFIPEDRMKENAYLGAILFPCGLLIFGWTAAYGVNIAAPMVGTFLFGVGSMLVFGMVTTMLTEFMPRKASAGIALNNFVRNILSAIGTIVASPLIDAIGDGWLFTILSLVCLVSGAVTILSMRHYGERWRANMGDRMEKAMGD